ncbi:electron transport complex subunit RsxC [Proteiniclasticum sp. SCR006]|uniref:Ion-translocating oxidoreductase complex subunit C n=1 Tax=Proteiniclasticum aestuarii TaxID=2817862 RepID=A0A939H6K6_9CLOT|nr:electron transport complex subunit RsxC [Proteiniclasticum aestuarii]MBO1265202.1 electron transport complex subunit RsxC [Proteiniclasticum aestuarii]
MRIFFMGKHGGSHPKENKERTSHLPITVAKVPGELVFPLSMHIGAPAKTVVEVGQKVKIGTLLAEAGGFVCAPVHASVSGEVTAIEKRPTLSGPAECIVVKNDGKDTFEESIKEREVPGDNQEILDIIRNAGIVGMGGAAFPTAVKLDPPKGSVIDTLIINGAECEPYSTSDHRVMVEEGDEIIKGVQIARKLFPKLKKVFIAIEDNKPDAIEAMKKAASEEKDIEVRPLHTMYPRGSEKNLIKDLTGREVPPGGLPAGVRCVLMNVSTTRAVYRAVALGEPLYQRVVSVSGTPVKNPKNLLVRVGTPVESLLEECEGFTEPVEKLLSGGPMMGRALPDVKVPIIKAMTAITALTEEEARVGEESDCIMCAECIHVCPVSLQPILISEAYNRGDLDAAKKLGAMDCIECGNCSYICPSKISLLDNIRNAKAAIKAQQEKEGA